MSEIEELKEEVAQLKVLTETLLKVVWMQRGFSKDFANKAEKDLERFWDEHLKKQNKIPKIVYNTEQVAQV